MRRLAVTAASAMLVGALLVGCGGGSPLLHPARTLPKGEVRGATGFSANVVAGDLSSSFRAAKNEAITNPDVPGLPGTDVVYSKGALVAAAAAPGLAPFVGARVGVGDHFEGGLAYTGRGARIDLRKSIDRKNMSLSAGIGGSGVFYGHQDGSELPNVDLGQLHGYGADIPLLIGWTVPNDLYMLWLGARGGWEHVDVSLVRSEPKAVDLGTPPITLSADRFFAGGLLGFAVGFRHVHVALELDVAYQSISGSYNQTNASVSGVTLAPASALWIEF
jgi:hypothetical protein